MPDFQPLSLSLARELRKVSQTQLATASETAQSAISKAENGLAIPDPITVERWGRALSLPEKFFYTDLASVWQLRPLFRKKKTEKKVEVQSVHATLGWVVFHIQTMERSVALPDAKIPHVDAESIGGAAEAARELRLLWRQPLGPIANICRLVESNGAVIVPTDLVVDGVSAVTPDTNRPVVLFKRGASVDRMRFTIAHELGHILMHRDVILPATCEDEADEFAGEFLVPGRELRAQIRGHRITVDLLAKLKRYWRTSMSMLLSQCKRIGAISDAGASRIFRQMNAMGYLRNEPVEIAPEAPEVAAELVRVHLEELNYSPEQLASVLLLYPDEFLARYMPESRPRLRLVTPDRPS